MQSKSILFQKCEKILDKYLETTQLYDRLFYLYIQRGDIIGAQELYKNNICPTNIDYQLLIDIMYYTNGNWDY